LQVYGFVFVGLFLVFCPLIPDYSRTSAMVPSSSNRFVFFTFTYFSPLIFFGIACALKRAFSCRVPPAFFYLYHNRLFCFPAVSRFLAGPFPATSLWALVVEEFRECLPSPFTYGIDGPFSWN